MIKNINGYAKKLPRKDSRLGISTYQFGNWEYQDDLVFTKGCSK